MRLAGPIFSHVKANKLGKVYAAETGFHIEHDPDTVRAPDVAFVRRDRLPPAGQRGFFQGPPDLAVEVLSPDDSASEVLAKVQDWLAAGCELVWVVDPRTRTVSVYHSPRQAEMLGEGDRLTGGDVLPGFDLSVAEIFAE
jgi:Uma2 family endonuclease